MDSNGAGPVVSLSLEKLTKATPYDYLHLTKVQNFSAWHYSRYYLKATNRPIEPLTLTTKDNRQWELSANESTYVVYYNTAAMQFCSIQFQVTMAIISPFGHLAKLHNWRWAKGAGRPLQFRFNRKDLDKLAVGGDLKLLIWISQVPIDLLSAVPFELGGRKQDFAAMQLWTRENLFSAHSNGYANAFQMKMNSFESIFDRQLLPTYWNRGDWAIRPRPAVLPQIFFVRPMRRPALAG